MQDGSGSAQAGPLLRARCAACGGPLVGNKTGRAGETKRGYRCTAADCSARVHVLSEPLEELVGAKIKANARRWTSGPDATEVARLGVERLAAQAELERYVTDLEAQGILGPDVWRKGLSAREDAREAAQVACDAARESSYMPDLDSPSAEDLARMVDELTVRRGREPLSKRVHLKLKARLG